MMPYMPYFLSYYCTSHSTCCTETKPKKSLKQQKHRNHLEEKITSLGEKKCQMMNLLSLCTWRKNSNQYRLHPSEKNKFHYITIATNVQNFDNKCATFTKYTHIRLTTLFQGLPGWASTRKVKPIWILLKLETMTGSGTSWAICKSAPCSRQITMPATHHSLFYRPDALPAAQPTASKHWRQL